MKRQIKFLSMVLFLILWGTVEMSAQSKHELSVYGGGGLSTLNYKVTIGEQKSGLGGQIGLGYHFFFSPKWGIGTGVELASYNAKFNADALYSRYMTTDIDGDAFEFHSTANGYKETQRAMMLQIPLMLQFQTDGKQQFYAAAGGKVGIPLNGKYSTTASFSNAGYYPYENSLYDTQEFVGFGNFPNKKAEGDLNFKTAFFVSAEAGVKWRLSDGLSLYTGAYMDYGLNTQSIASQPSLVEYNKANPPEFIVNSILTTDFPFSPSASSHLATALYQRLCYTDKIRPMAAGIKLRLAFGSGGK